MTAVTNVLERGMRWVVYLCMSYTISIWAANLWYYMSLMIVVTVLVSLHALYYFNLGY